MAANYKEELVGVFGYPVAENPTCVMQNAAFAAAGLNWRYLTIEVRPEQLAGAIGGLRAMNFHGVNLTIPHKVAVMGLLDEVRPDAAMIGAVNTVRVEAGRLIGENTDGKGFVRGIREDARMDPGGKNVVILGAGGAARAVAVELLLADVGALTIVNRSPARGQQIVANLVKHFPNKTVRLVEWRGTQPVGKDVDVLINATSIGLYPDTSMPAVDLEGARGDLLVCDAIPNPPDTRFLQEAWRRGMRTLNGLAMLVYQGAIGFAMWTGQKADEAAMKAALAKAFENG